MKKTLQSLQLSLLNIGYAQLDPKWSYKNVISPFTRLYYITKGSAKVYHSDQAFDLKPGHIYLIPSYQYGNYECELSHEQYYISFFEDVNNGYSIYNLFSFEYERKATESDLFYFKQLLKLNPNRALENDDPEVYDNRQTLQSFKTKNEELSNAEYLETNGLLRVLLSRFISKPKNPYIDSKISNSRLGQVMNFIGEHLHQDITVQKLADYCNLSSDHFSKIFKRKFGMRPNSYIQSKRVERAQLLLLTTDYTLKQIAEKVGLENISYFSRVFKKHIGNTPGQYRNENLFV